MKVIYCEVTVENTGTAEYNNVLMFTFESNDGISILLPYEGFFIKPLAAGESRDIKVYFDNEKDNLQSGELSYSAGDFSSPYFEFPSIEK